MTGERQSKYLPRHYVWLLEYVESTYCELKHADLQQQDFPMEEYSNQLPDLEQPTSRIEKEISSFHPAIKADTESGILRKKFLRIPPLVLTAAEHGPYYCKHVHSSPTPKEKDSFMHNKRKKNKRKMKSEWQNILFKLHLRDSNVTKSNQNQNTNHKVRLLSIS